MIKGIIGAPFAGIVVIIILGFFVEDQRILIGAGGAVALIIVYLSIFGENIRCELDANGVWRYYQKGRLKKTVDLTNCMIGYHQKGEAGILGSYDINLQIIDQQEGESFIDCSPLGPGRFADMYEKMKKFTPEEPEVLLAGNE